MALSGASLAAASAGASADPGGGITVSPSFSYGSPKTRFTVMAS